MTAWRIPAMAAAVLLCACACRAAEFKSSQGFAIAYPDGWLVLSKDLPEQARQGVLSRIKRLRAVDLNRVAVVICEDNPAEFAADFNVVVGSGKGLAGKSEGEMRALLADEYRKVGVAVSDVKVGKIKVGLLDAVSVHFNAVLEGVAQPQRQWQVTVADKRRTFTITCSAPQADFARYEPAFAAAVSSLRTGPDSSVAGWLDNPLVRYGLIGVVVACVLLWLKTRMRRKE